MICHQHTAACCLVVLTLTAFAQGSASNWSADELTQFRSDLYAKGGQADGDVCGELERRYGNLVSAGRDLGISAAEWSQVRMLGSDAHKGCRQAIRSMEAAQAEDETALERLYRSERWYQINRALSGYRYWQAWADLSAAGVVATSSERIRLLAAAKRGFETSALRILYPGLVYGSWLGLAYVDQAQQENERAASRLQQLKQALASDPGNPLHEIVDYELALVELQKGRKSAIPGAEIQALTPTQARLLEEQAIDLLQQHRAQGKVGRGKGGGGRGKGAKEAAEYLKVLMESEYLDDRLLERVLGYLEEIAGEEIGLVGLLVDSEYAHKYEQYETAVLKYQKFVEQGGKFLGLELSRFQYHYAAALYRLELFDESLHELEQLLGGDESAMQADAATKLHFLVSDALYKARPRESERLRLVASAQRFLQRMPGDPDASYAHLSLGRLVADAGLRAGHLRQAGADDRLSATVKAAGADASIEEFHRVLLMSGSAAAVVSARNALAAIQGLPQRMRRATRIRVLEVQIRTVIGESSAHLREELQRLDLESQLDSGLQRILIWSRLRILERLPGGLEDYLSNRPSAENEALIDQEIFLLLQELMHEGDAERVHALSADWLQLLPQQPQLHRQVWLLDIDALRILKRYNHALASAQEMVDSYPKSGNAWQILAEVSEEADEPFIADRTWAEIARSQSQGSEKWLVAMMRRISLLNRQPGSASEHCSLVKAVTVYRHRLLPEYVAQLNRANHNGDCVSSGGDK